MKKQITILTIFILICFSSLQAQVSQQWLTSYNGPYNADDETNAIAVDNSGNVYVTGYSNDSSYFYYDYATIKYNSSGVQQWVQRYNGSADGDDYATSIAVDGAGNVYVTGYSTGIGTGFDFVTIKYNSAGIQQWIQTYDGPGSGDDITFILKLDVSGNVYVTGGSAGVGTENDYATIKYNSAGVQQWVQRYNGPGNSSDMARSLAVDGSGNVYVTGASMGIGTDNDFATIKYDSNGDSLWVARYNGPGNFFDQATEVAVDPLGNVYVGGASSSLPSFATEDFATIKYNSNGVQQWVRRYGESGTHPDVITSMAVDGSGNVYVTGQSILISSVTDFDYATIKYNTNGDSLWVKRYNGPGDSYDSPNSLQIDASGNVYVTGLSFGLITADYATIKYNSSGDQQWIIRLEGAAGFSNGKLALDDSANVYLAANIPDNNFTSDYATLKYFQDIPSPVELSSFTSIVNNRDVTLNWATVSETNNSGFNIERSIVNDLTGEAGQWAAVGTVQGSGTTSLPKNYSFTDRGLNSGKFHYRLKQTDFNGNFEYFNLVGEVNVGIPAKFDLSQNYPNPFNPSTKINYSLPSDGKVSLKLFDISGRELMTLVNEIQSAGYYTVTFNGANLSSGVYFYRLNSESNSQSPSGGFVETKKMTLIK